MAYLQFDQFQDGSAGATVRMPANPLGALERDIVRMSYRDGRSSVREIGRLARIGDWLTGRRRQSGLANPRLETLRRFAILYRLDGQALDGGEALALAGAGFNAREVDEVRSLVDRHVISDARSSKRVLSTVFAGLMSIAGLSGITLLIQQATEDFAVSTIMAGIIVVTLASLHRPA